MLVNDFRALGYILCAIIAFCGLVAVVELGKLLWSKIKKGGK